MTLQNLLFGLIDFNVTIPDSKNYGSIVSVSWVLPEGTTNPTYLKQDPITGSYSEFPYDSSTGEGARWDASTNTLTVYVRDDGKYEVLDIKLDNKIKNIINGGRYDQLISDLGSKKQISAVGAALNLNY